MKPILDFLSKIEPDKKKSPLLHTLYDGIHTFLYAPNFITRRGTHIRDGMDLKRTMFHVVIALQLSYLLGTWNIGHQHFVALGMHEHILAGLHLKIAYGLIQLLPMFIVVHVVGLGIEFYYASVKGHSIEEGFLVSGALIPLIMPPDIPLWIVALSVIFAVWVGKEAFGGTGMNIFNVALLSRVFVFFAYPTTISGDQVWVAGLESAAEGAMVSYNSISFFFINYIFNPLFSWFNWSTFDLTATVVDGYTGATPLALAFEGGWERVTEVYSLTQIVWGAIPGSIGETGKIFIIMGAIFLIVVGIASWRIMLAMLLGTILTGMLFNMWGATPFLTVPWQYHLFMGSFFFAMAFMATDPVTASSTPLGKLIYGFMIGVIGMIVRVMNPAYPEGWMLAILFMNVFAPLIDYYILEANISKRLKRATLQ